MRLRKNVAVLAAGLVCAFQVASAQPAATLDDLAFIAGHWRGELEGGLIEEIWTAPSGDNMMGSFRMVDEGRGVFYELMLIEMTEAGPVLRLKHFSPGLVGWEEKAEVNSYPLIELEGRAAIFERADGASRLVYSRTSPRDLRIQLRSLEAGEWETTEFAFTLAP